MKTILSLLEYYCLKMYHNHESAKIIRKFIFILPDQIELEMDIIKLIRNELFILGYNLYNILLYWVL